MWPFKRRHRPEQAEIDSHLAHLNSLSYAYQDAEHALDVSWLDRQVGVELAWFYRHRIRLSRDTSGEHIILHREEEYS